MKLLASARLLLGIALPAAALAQPVANPQAPAAPDDPQISRQPSLPEITRGQQIVIQGKNFAPGAYSVYLAKDGDPRNGIQLPATAAVDKQSLTFTVPADNKVPIDRYLVSVAVGGKYYPVPGDLRLLADAQAPVTLDAINPITVYPADRAGLDFEISGKNLGNPASNNLLSLVDRGYVTTGSDAECAASKASGNYQKTCLEVEQGMETRKLRVLGFQRGTYDGPIRIRVQVGNNVSNDLPVTFSRVSARAVSWGALALFLIVMGIVVRLAWKGVGEETIGGKKYSPWHGFFLDKETNSYSLSKFQMLVWLSVFIFGYLYLFLSRILIQWKFELPPVPDGMPSMLAISAGTAVAAAGATETRGSKGQGAIHPSAADFVSTGGVVVGERFQFFVWTLVGAFGFIALLLWRDPATLDKLPPIPDSFLYVMGISSAGYLAGKVTRKPGPVIRSLMVSSIGPTKSAPAQTQMSIKLMGESLAEDATIKVDNKELRAAQYALTFITHQDGAPDPKFCSELQVDLLDAQAYLEGPHTLTLTNRDGQSASTAFPVDPLAIDTASFDATKKVLTVTGKNFSDTLTAQWDATDAEKVTWDKKQTLTITFKDPQTQPGTLTLKSPIGLRASKQIP